MPLLSAKNKHRSKAKQRGFTLIELMVVLAIIGILAALVVPNVLNRADDARVTAARTDIGNLMQALKLYRLDNQRYPSADQGLQALVVQPAAGPAPLNWKPYIDKLPNDPWGKPYQYMNPGLKGEVDVLSLGADVNLAAKVKTPTSAAGNKPHAAPARADFAGAFGGVGHHRYLFRWCCPCDAR